LTELSLDSGSGYEILSESDSSDNYLWSPDPTSQWITLTAGQEYPIKTRHVQGSGNDFMTTSVEVKRTAGAAAHPNQKPKSQTVTISQTIVRQEIEITLDPIDNFSNAGEPGTEFNLVYTTTSTDPDDAGADIFITSPAVLTKATCPDMIAAFAYIPVEKECQKSDTATGSTWTIKFLWNQPTDYVTALSVTGDVGGATPSTKTVSQTGTSGNCISGEYTLRVTDF